MAKHAPVLAVGLISGTSADGIDAALVALSEPGGRPHVDLRAFETVPYPAEVRSALFRCFEDAATASEICVLNAVIGELFADAAERVIRAAGVSPTDLAFAASHGQTIWHQPGARRCSGVQVFRCSGGADADPDSSTLDAQRSTVYPPNACPPYGGGGLNAQRPTAATLQVGEAARIAERLRVPVVSDFRQQDIAAGGQGAPLVPYLDFLLYSDPLESRAVQNIGGIGNVTYLRAGGRLGDVMGFDTGPGNAMIDAAAELVTGGALACDRDGHIAAGAEVDTALLRELLAEPYFQLPPPKSTGRELFSARRVRELWERGHQGPRLVSTLTQLTVDSTAEAYSRWLGPVDCVILGGGGARNPELVRRLKTAVAPARVLTNEDFGIDSDAKEAIAFAVFGWETLRNRPSNVPSATGASRLVIQGKVCRP
jgi:anhydro-N-acetylmuramic acid kinase